MNEGLEEIPPSDASNDKPPARKRPAQDDSSDEEDEDDEGSDVEAEIMQLSSLKRLTEGLMQQQKELRRSNGQLAELIQQARERTGVVQDIQEQQNAIPPQQVGITNDQIERIKEMLFAYTQQGNMGQAAALLSLLQLLNQQMQQEQQQQEAARLPQGGNNGGQDDENPYQDFFRQLQQVNERINHVGQGNQQAVAQYNGPQDININGSLEIAAGLSQLLDPAWVASQIRGPPVPLHFETESNAESDNYDEEDDGDDEA